jgi:NADPH2:quinone reductase
MQAILLTAPGGTDVLKLSEVPLPELSTPEHIRVRLHAAGINPVDYKMRQKGGFFPEKLPIILGCDGAGVVEAIGDAVTRFKVGDEVYFFNGGIGGPESGNYAEYTVIHQEYAAIKPKNITLIEAASVPLAWLTAWESLIDRARLQSKQTALIHAGAGGVGFLAIQLAKHLGARVLTTVSSQEKADFVQSLGADQWINYQETDFVSATLDWTDGQGAEVVFDTVGGETFCRSFGATKIYGTVVTLLEEVCSSDAVKIAKLRNLSVIYELMLTPMHLKMHAERIKQRKALEEATHLIETGKLQLKVSQVLPLAQAIEAHQLIESGHTIGKIVLSI